MVTGIIPVRTHIITHKDDIADVAYKYARNIVGSKDVICLAESVVAISQGRYYRPEDISPSFTAKILSKYTKRDGSLTNPSSMELALRESGKIRVLTGATIGGITRLGGIKGVFFKVAGSDIARIDDVARTMHPFDTYIVMGPKNPEQTAKKVQEKLQVEAAVVDVNDLKYVDVLGTTPGIDSSKLSKLLESNPFGNDDQKTPLIVLKDFF